MAKKKQDSSSSKTAKAKTGKASKVDNAVVAAGDTTESNKRTGSSSPAQHRGMSSDMIGDAAGGVWTVLSSQGPQTVASLKKSVDAPEELILSAIGWLAREGKLSFESNGRALKIGLSE